MDPLPTTGIDLPPICKSTRQKDTRCCIRTRAEVTSYSEEFANLIHHKYPGDDYFDLMSGVDASSPRDRLILRTFSLPAVAVAVSSLAG